MSLVTICLFVYLAVTQVVAGETLNLCDQFQGYNSTSEPFYFNNNVWGNDSSGYQCTDVNDGGSSFTVTYKWTGTPTLVKSYPYMKPFPSRLPVQLQNVSRLDFSANWSTVVTSTNDDSPAAYDAANLYANVAIDMFLSTDAANSTGQGPPIEIMIWPWWCPTVKPLGWDESTPGIDKVSVSGTNFSLYHGYNDRQQHVFSWLADQNLTSTNADYGPLLKYIWQKGLLAGSLYLGQLEFGTEILHADEEMRFSAENYKLQLIRQGDPEDITTTSSASTMTATSAPTSSVASTSSSAATTTATRSSSSGNRAPPETVTSGLLFSAAFLLRFWL